MAISLLSVLMKLIVIERHLHHQREERADADDNTISNSRVKYLDPIRERRHFGLNGLDEVGMNTIPKTHFGIGLGY
jgi:hypothetical protein